MLKLLKKNTLFLTLALAIIAMCAVGAQAADVANVEVSFSDGAGSGGNNSLLGDSGGNAGWSLRSGLLGGTKAGGDLNWAVRGINAENGNFRRVRLQYGTINHLEFQGRRGDSQGNGTFVLIDFAGDIVNNFNFAEFAHSNAPDANALAYRILVRDAATSKWYASVEVNETGSNTQATDTGWQEVTNANAIGMNIANTDAAAAFTTDLFTFGTAAALPAGLGIDRGGLYLTDRPAGNSSPQINLIKFSDSAGDAPAKLAASDNPLTLTTINFGEEDVTTKSISISNSGDLDLVLTSATVAGLGFSLNDPDSVDDFDITLIGGQSTDFEIGFDATLLGNNSVAGDWGGTLTILSNDASSPTIIDLTVRVQVGIDPASVETWMLYGKEE